ncbi:MAG TPA: phosphatidylglycerophosphatase A [Spirochaetota bacterium]|nr:phosphatidylglycerophosphatase A [Spirochaetota bacterium]HPJ34731.1 phosphatidylglycerophosphatase A [Spirochaetota bacterium]
MKIDEFLFTAFYSGYCPVAPGTAGTLVAMAIYIVENLIFAGVNSGLLNVINLVIVVGLIYPSIKLTDRAEDFYKSKDPQSVVLDEVIGYWISVLFLPFSFSYAVLAFLLFRLFDIVKPFPARNLQSLSGGLGIMIDDIIAGIYALIVMHIADYFFSYYNIILP